MSTGNIIFIGDWVKIEGGYERVTDIGIHDMILTSWSGWLNADSPIIEQVLSHDEMINNETETLL